MPDAPWCESACWLSGVVCDPGTNPSVLRAELTKLGISAGVMWKPLHKQKPYAGSPRSALDVCDGIWDRIVTLPCSASIGDTEVSRVISALREATPRAIAAASEAA